VPSTNSVRTQEDPAPGDLLTRRSGARRYAPDGTYDGHGVSWLDLILGAVLYGEAWRNAHHVDPTCARHGVEPGQLDLSAELIQLMEKAGWVRDVHWPTAERLAALRA
jgi:fatty-acid desaturase